MKIQTTNSVTENKIKVLVNGPSGSGKTSLAKTLVNGGYRPLIISFESGLRSLYDSHIDFIDGTVDNDGKPLAKELRLPRLFEIYRYVLTDEARKKYDVIFSDSLSEICQCAFDAIRKEYPENKDNLVVYGMLAQKMKDILRAFRDIPYYHVVFTCLTKIEKDPNGVRYAGFDLIGSIADKVPGYLDEVFYLRVDKDGNRSIMCNSTDTVIAKDRSGKLNSVEPADLGLIFDKILGK